MIQKELPFESLKKLVLLSEPDFILIEGYKQENGPKVVFARNNIEYDELKRLENIVLLIGPMKQAKYEQIYSREMKEELNKWFVQWINKK